MLRRQRKRTSDTPAKLLIVGLGNPGEKYQGTRHNVGHEVVQAFLEKHGGSLKKSKEHALCSEVRVDSERITLAIPTTFMNESGLAVRRLVQRYKISDKENLVVVHDELDLLPGQMKIKLGGGLAGHNGLKSIEKHLQTSDFGRIRIGIGKPHSSELGKSFVLKRPSKEDRIRIDLCVQRSIEAIESLISMGYEKTMNQFNGDI